jgi:secreted trypsin-like serine protease
VHRKIRQLVGAVAATAALGVISLAAPAEASAIENGEPADQVTSQFVARLVVDKGALRGKSYCTGSLVAPKLVLTAAHCVTSLRPSDWSVTFGYGTDQSEKFGVTHVHKFSADAGASAGGNGGFAKSSDDLALLELAKPVTSRQPIALDTGTDTIANSAGAWVVELGYGVTRDDTKQVPLPGSPKTQHLADTIKRAGQLLVGADPAFSTAAGARLDPPGLIVSADPGYDKANSVISGRCRTGDSGGPLLLDTASGPVILGVLSLVDGKADERGRWTCQYTRVDNGDPYRTWLDSMINRIGNV